MAAYDDQPVRHAGVRLGLGNRVGRLATLGALREHEIRVGEDDEHVHARVSAGEVAEVHFVT